MIDRDRYEWELAQLEALCQQFVNTRDRAESEDKFGVLLLLVGMIGGQCLRIWELGEPAGLFDVSRLEVFKPFLH
ncbi:MAG TPA: hypothetical protein VLI07_18630 [Candidatus Binatus sp.]|nr:hypothetical protein [Candidatus Binatus sp.]